MKEFTMAEKMRLVRDRDDLVLPLSEELIRRLNIELDDELELVSAEPGRMTLNLVKSPDPGPTNK